MSGLAKMVLKDEEFAKIKQKSEYDDDIGDWVIPPFILKGKEVGLLDFGSANHDKFKKPSGNFLQRILKRNKGKYAQIVAAHRQADLFLATSNFTRNELIDVLKAQVEV